MTIYNHGEDYPPVMYLKKPETESKISVRPHRMADTDTWYVDIPIAEDDECGIWSIDAIMLFSSDNSQVWYIRLGRDGDPEAYYVDLSRGDYEVRGTSSDVEDISTAAVADIPAKEYDGTPYDVEPVVTLGEKTLVKGTDYYLAYPYCEGNTAPSDAGEYILVITGFGKYTGSIDKPFTITPVLIEGADVSGISDKTYTGKAITQSPVVAIDSVKLEEGKDYAASCKNNTKAGTAEVIITGKGNYSGTITKTFTINKATNPLKISAKTATVKYSKLKKKAQTLAVTKVIKFTKDAKDKKTYTLSSAKKGKKSFKKYFTINKTTGKVTVKKGLKKGTYKVKVKVKAAGNTNYKASSAKTVTFTIKVK